MDIGIVTATSESVKFALQKIEDMQSSKAANLSGATTLSGVFSKLKSLEEILKQFHRVLMDAQANWGDSQNTDPNYQNYQEIQDVSERIGTAIFTFMNKGAEMKPSTFAATFKTSEFNPKPVNFFALYNLKVDIGEILLKVGTINLGGPSNRAITQPDQQSPSNVDDIWLTGLDIHQKCIHFRLIDQRIQTRSMVQVVGTIGFAKTVLAEKIYQSSEVKAHFDFSFWLFPQINLETKDENHGFKRHTYLLKPIDILRKMLLKIGDTNSLVAHYDDNQIISRLRESLEDKRCLVVVDNKWKELWTLVNSAFPDRNKGSRVLITTEKQVESDYTYELPFFDYHGSFKLPKNLRKIDFLKCDDDRTHLGMDDGIHWYTKLPIVLKMCIAYTAAVFPCGSVVVADALIRLWIVEGFIPHEEGRTKNIAESYLQHLAQRGLVRIIWAYYHNQDTHRIRSIILHPCLHCILEKSHENGSLPVKVIHSDHAFNNYDYAEDTHENLPHFYRLALHLPYQFNPVSSFEKGSKLQFFNYANLHSLFFFGYVAPVKSSPFNFLRVLAVFSSHIQFPDEHTQSWLEKLINLRYLGFIVCLVEGRSLGKTIGCLGKLEILDLSGSIVSGLHDQGFQDFKKNNTNVEIVDPVKEELLESWSPVPDMLQ